MSFNNHSSLFFLSSLGPQSVPLRGEPQQQQGGSRGEEEEGGPEGDRGSGGDRHPHPHARPSLLSPLSAELQRLLQDVSAPPPLFFQQQQQQQQQQQFLLQQQQDQLLRLSQQQQQQQQQQLFLSPSPGSSSTDDDSASFSSHSSLARPLKSSSSRKRAAKRMVPAEEKDDKYKARRLRNTLAARRSRERKRLREIGGEMAVHAAGLAPLPPGSRLQLDGLDLDNSAPSEDDEPVEDLLLAELDALAADVRRRLAQAP